MIPKFLKPLLRPFRPYYFPLVYKKKEYTASKKFYNDFLTSNDIVIEVGARIGEITLILSDIVKHVYAFEPNPDSYKILKSFTKKKDNITTYDVGVGEKNQLTWLNIIEDDPLSVATSFKKIQGKNYSTTKKKVKIARIDKMNFTLRPTTLVIDCEGFELESLKGAKGILKDIQKIAIETHILDDGTNTLDPVLFYLNDIFDVNVKHDPDDNPWIIGKNKLYFQKK